MKPEQNLCLFGHEKPQKILHHAYENNSLAGAWLFVGPKGVGKTTCAYQIIRFLLNDSSSDAIEQIAKKIHPNLLVIDAENSEKKEIHIDDIKNITNFLRLSAAHSKWRIVLIDGAEKLNRHAANAILKILEEPPAFSLFILITHMAGALLPTIRSRCRYIDFKPLSEDDMMKCLAQINKDFSQEEIAKAINFANGSPGLAIDYIENNLGESYLRLLELWSKSPYINVKSVQNLLNTISGKKLHVLNLVFQLFFTRLNQYALGIDFQGELVQEEKIIMENILKSYDLKYWLEKWKRSQELLYGLETGNLDTTQTLITIFSEARAL